ncbi:MAG: selenocysteine-specific translation elongation factor [Proteobacteria bacterium]|nr:selenocysteine-specific translation elongation factor [Pseudomonadota bacterium]
MERATPSLVLGTAGHIDHGKTALVCALTGVDTDRLPEEKARGITIDLGFAALDLPGDLRVSVVDVPGHERLVRTMVSGASGFDLVLLVVAADEGVMPQTREHVAICDLLGIERGVVALTKCDLVDEEMRELAAEDVRDLLASSALAGSAIVPVSSVEETGLDALRAALAETVDGASGRTPRSGPPRLAIDRVFAMRGFGTVVTGTLVGSALQTGDAVEILPGGRRARIRGLQSHGVASDRVEPGARCAVNLQGVEVAELSRGEVVTAPGALAPTDTFDVELSWLPGAPDLLDFAAIELLAGTAERRARLAPIGSGVSAGDRGFARIHVDGEPLALLPGDRFIARGFARTEAGGATVGGGVVLDVAPPRRRRSDPALSRDLEIFARREPAADLLQRILRTGLSGVARARLVRETGLPEAQVDAELDALRVEGSAEPVAEGAGAGAFGDRLWVAVETWRQLEDRMLAALAEYHEKEPLRPGMPRGALRGRLPENVRAETAERALARLEERDAVRVEGDLVRLREHAPRLDPEAQAAVERIAAEARAAGLEPPAPREWAKRLGLDTDRFRDLVAHLEREEQLVRAPGDLWFDSRAVDDLRDRVVAHLREHGELDTPSYKRLIGTSRRVAVPLMELLDELHVTRRRGNVRILRRDRDRSQ